MNIGVCPHHLFKLRVLSRYGLHAEINGVLFQPKLIVRSQRDVHVAVVARQYRAVYRRLFQAGILEDELAPAECHFHQHNDGAGVDEMFDCPLGVFDARLPAPWIKKWDHHKKWFPDLIFVE